MPFSLGDTVELPLVITVDSVQTAVVLHYEFTNMAGLSDDAAIADDILFGYWRDVFFTTIWAPANSNQIAATCGVMRKVLVQPESPITRSFNVPGDISGDNSPSNSGVIISKKASGNTRGFNGWNNWPAPLESHTERGRLTTEAHDLWIPVANALQAEITGAPAGVQMKPVLFSREPPVATKDIVLAFVRTPIHKHRSRNARLCPI